MEIFFNLVFKYKKNLGMGGYILTLLSPKKYQNVQSLINHIYQAHV